MLKIAFFHTFIAAMLLSLPTGTKAETSSQLKFYVWSDNLAPIIAQDSTKGEFFGIVVDLFSALHRDNALDVEYIVHNRIRGEQQLYKGKFHATILSPQWVEKPEQLIFSQPIYEHVEYLYATQPIADAPLRDLMNQHLICTRRGYRYPKFNELFDNKIAKRVDSNSEEAMLRMLLLGRCDYVLSNEFVAEFLIEQSGWQNQIYKSPNAVDSVGFKLAFHPSKVLLKEKIDSHIEQLKRNGTLAQIITYHRGQAMQRAQSDIVLN